MHHSLGTIESSTLTYNIPQRWIQSHKVSDGFFSFHSLVDYYQQY